MNYNVSSAMMILILDNAACRQRRSDHVEDDGIKTITYDEYVNAGIPDALLQGLGFAETLCAEPTDTEDQDDAGEVQTKQTEAAVVSVSSTDMQSQTGAAAAMVPLSLIQVGNAVLPVPVVAQNNLTPSSSCVSVSGSSNNTPSTVNKDVSILSTIPSLPGLVGSTVPGALLATGDAGKLPYVDQNGRVMGCVQYPSTVLGPSQLVQMIDSNGRIISDQLKQNAPVVDKDGRVITSQVQQNTPVVDKDGRIITSQVQHNTPVVDKDGRIITSTMSVLAGNSKSSTAVRSSNVEQQSKSNSEYSTDHFAIIHNKITSSLLTFHPPHYAKSAVRLV